MNMKVENEMALPITKSVTVMLLEPYAGKLARTVLRGESSRKGADLLDRFMIFFSYYLINIGIYVSCPGRLLPVGYCNTVFYIKRNGVIV